MSKFLRVFVALNFLVSANSVILSQPAQATGCDDVKFIFARGSGEELSGPSMHAWQSTIEKHLKSSHLKYSFYELGSSTQNGFRYPAVAVAGSLKGFTNLIGAAISGGDSFEFGQSVLSGKFELKNYLTKVSSTCPQTKFVLGGYSQGAMVISGSLPQIDPKNVIYASTFGDPKLYLPEGAGAVPAACLGHRLSNYRAYVPDCRAYEGVLGSYRPYQSAGYTDKLGTWCNKKDVMCSSGLSISDHTSYVSEELYTQAAYKINSKLKLAFPQAFDNATSESEINPTIHNLAIVIDSSASMSYMLKSYKNEAKRLATQVFNQGGRVALYEYRDLKDPFHPIKRCDFSCDFEQFSSRLDKIRTDGGGDTDESALSAILYAMNTLKWQKGATKSIVLLTDAGYFSPDHDGTTLADVRNRSLEIDPVNVYIVTDQSELSTYQELAQSTNGQVFDFRSEGATLAILDRPEVEFPMETYSGVVGEEFVFNAITPSLNLRYDWDLDGDGIFELQNAAPTIKHAYNRPSTHFIQVKVTDNHGLSSTMSATVEVAASRARTSSIRNLVTRSASKNSVEVQFSTDASRVMVVMDGVIFGILDTTTRQSFTIEDVFISHALRLIPYDEQDQRGEASEIVITPPQTPTVPNTGSSTLETGIWRKYYYVD